MNQLKSEHSKGAKFRVNIILELEGKNTPKLISMFLKDSMQSQTVSELCTDD